MKRRAILAATGVAVTGAVGYGLARWLRTRSVMPPEQFAELYRDPLPAPDAGLSVYHLGHSLVGRDMPVMLDQLAHSAGFGGHSHASQLGWGASLQQHWQGADAVPGFAEENAHANHKPVKPALASGAFDAVVLTEMVELRDAIRYHDSARHLALWAQFVRQAKPQTRLYLYETWHRLDDPEGWMHRVDADLSRAWEGQLLRVAMAEPGVGTIHVIPGGQVLAAATRAIEAGEVPGLITREDLFSRDATGQVDPIHLNDLGNYIIALAHFATLYHRSPERLPYALRVADGRPAASVPGGAAAVLQRLVWKVVTGYALTGVAN